MRNVAAKMAVVPLPKKTGGGTSLAPRERHYLVEMSYKVKLTVVFGQPPAQRTRNNYGVKDHLSPGKFRLRLGAPQLDPDFERQEGVPSTQEAPHRRQALQVGTGSIVPLVQHRQGQELQEVQLVDSKIQNVNSLTYRSVSKN